jgi:hypothetical protein
MAAKSVSRAGWGMRQEHYTRAQMEVALEDLREAAGAVVAAHEMGMSLATSQAVVALKALLPRRVRP